MATSSAVVAGDLATAANYNDLRTDVLATHIHDGIDGATLTDASVIAGLTLGDLVQGDTIHAPADNTLARLAKGSDGEVLTLASGSPSWIAGSVYTDAEALAAAVQAGAITNGVTKAPTHDAVFDVKATADAAQTAGEVDADIATHTGIATAHHTKYTNGEAVTAAKTVKLDDFATPDDNTDLDYSTARHGLVPKGTNVGNFLKDDGAWAAPAKIATGQYTGDGALSQAITGVGFQVKTLWIIQQGADGDQDPLFWTTDGIVDNDASGLSFTIAAGASAFNSFQNNRIIALGADGFTVDDAGSDADPNKLNQVYEYQAIG